MIASPRPRRSTLSIRYALPLLLVVPIIATVVLTVGFAIFNGRRAARQFGLTVSAKTVESIEQQILSYLDRPNLLNRSHAAVGSGLLNFNDTAAVAQFFWEQSQLSTDADLDSLSFGSTNGNFALVQRFPDGTGELRIRTEETAPNREFYRLNSAGVRAGRTRVQEYDPRTRPWYLAGVEAGKPIWSEIFQAADTPALLISSIVPIYERNNRLQGVLAATIRLTALNDFLATINVSPNGEAFVLEPSGNLVASSSDEPIVVETDGGERQRLLATDSSNPIVAATAEELRERLESLESLDQIESFSYQHDRGRQVVSVVSLAPEAGLPWLVVAVVPDRDFSGPIDANIRATLLVGLAIAIAAIALGLLAARWLVRPIEQLSGAARDIQADRFQAYTLQEVAERHDEFGELGRTFQDMAIVIGDRQQSFTAQVQQLRQQNASADADSLRGVEVAYYKALQSKSRWLRHQSSHDNSAGSPAER